MTYKPCNFGLYTDEDRTFFTSMTFDQWVEAKKNGLSPILSDPTIAERSGVAAGTLVSKHEAFIDGFIEGFLTRIYGVGYFAKVKAIVPEDADMVYDMQSYDEDDGKYLGYFVTSCIPAESLSLVEAWEAGPELAEEVEEEYFEEHSEGS